MTDIDREIAAALEEEDRVLAEGMEEIGMFSLFKTLFTGKSAWISVLSIIVGTILNILFFYAGWKFFTVEALDSKLLWGGGAWFLATMVAFMKVWFWLRMESNRVLREIKRIELQIVRLSAKMDA